LNNLKLLINDPAWSCLIPGLLAQATNETGDFTSEVSKGNNFAGIQYKSIIGRNFPYPCSKKEITEYKGTDSEVEGGARVPVGFAKFTDAKHFFLCYIKFVNEGGYISNTLDQVIKVKGQYQSGCNLCKTNSRDNFKSLNLNYLKLLMSGENQWSVTKDYVSHVMNSYIASFNIAKGFCSDTESVNTDPCYVEREIAVSDGTCLGKDGTTRKVTSVVGVGSRISTNKRTEAIYTTHLYWTSSYKSSCEGNLRKDAPILKVCK